jgi:acetolactate synthase-1/3 small subunit
MPESTLTLLYSHRTGALDRIVSLLRRRGFPIGGMTVERTHQADVGRMTVVVRQPRALAQVSRHLQRLPDVLEVTTSDDEEAVRREYALARVRCTPQQQDEVRALLKKRGARVLRVTPEGMVVEAAGSGEELDALFAELASYGIDESARTSPMALRLVSAQPQSA